MRRRRRSFGEARITTGQRAGHMVPGVRSYMIRCGTKVVGTGLAIQHRPGADVMACFDAIAGDLKSECRHFQSHKVARNWLRGKARMMEC